jgi:hypothetical protein
MENPVQFGSVRFHNIIFGAESMMLYSGQSKLLSVEKKNIRNIVLRYGFQSERPIAQVIFGIFVTILGLYFVLNFLIIARVNGVIYDIGCLSPLLLPIGIWFTIDGLRKRLYFEVVLDNDMRKFPLGKNPDQGELRKLINAASQLGYSIDATILDNNILQ